MNEQSIFLAAMEIADSNQRAAYLDQACAGDPSLRKQVDALLAAHERSGEFLDVPALRQLAGEAAEDQSFPDETIAGHRGAKGEIDLSFLQPSSKPGSLGQLLHYEVREVVGRGGCGIVLKAFDEKLERIVAIKVMAPELAATSPARKRFLREARATAAIRNENVVSIYAVEEQPLPFLVMEYIDGETLQQRLDRTGPLDVPAVLRISHQIANGLAAAHDKGLIHRDIKPGNILMEDGTDHIKITDFGLARSVDDASMTQSGVIAGTPLYMSPEQAQAHDIDHRSDLFSLGSVLYVMCSGRPPFRAASTLAVMKRVVEEQPRPIQGIIPETPDWLAGIIARLHAKNPEERFASAQEVTDLLSRCLFELEQHGRVDSLGDLLPMIQQQASEVKAEPAPASRPARPLSRNLIATAAMILVLLTGLGMTEGTGISKVGSTVIRLFSPEGTLVVEVDDPAVSVSIDGEELLITGAGAKEIRLKPGRYTVLASKDGKLLQQELVTVTRNGRQVVRVSREAGQGIPVGDLTKASDPNRRAAEFILSPPRNSKDVVQVNDVDQWLSKQKDLPVLPFRLTGVGVFWGSKLTDADLENFKGCKHLKRLFLGGTEVTKKGLANFNECSELRQLALVDGSFDDTALELFKDRAHQLTHLDLRGNVTDAGLAHFQDSTELGTLGLNYTGVSDKGLAYFTGNKKLKSLGLGNTAVSDAGLEHLARMPRLQSISLLKTQITEAGVMKLASALPECRIEWDGGVIGPTVADPDRRAAEWVLSIGGSLRIFAKGKESSIAKDGKLPDGPFHVTLVHLAETRIVDADLVHLKDLADLTSLCVHHFSGNKNITDAGVEHLLGLTQLEALDMWGAGITDVGLERLTALKKLRHLNLGRAKISDTGLAHVAALANVEHLNLAFTRVTSAGMSHLKSLTNLELLNLEATAVADDGLEHLQGMKWLQSLTLGGTRVTGAGLVHLRGLSRLKTLHLDFSPTTDAGLENLTGCTSLNLLGLQGTQVTDASLEHLTGLTGLTNLNLKQTKVTAAGVKGLAATLPRCRIEWDGGVIEPNASADADRSAAEWVLSLGGRIRVIGQDDEIIAAEVLPRGAFELTSVDVGKNSQVTDAGLAHFKGCQNLTSLTLNHTPVSDVGLVHFRECKNLTSLNLGGTRAGDIGLSYFRDCKNLTSLDLRTTHLTDVGLAHFKDCKELAYLDLARTQVTDAGLAHFKDCTKLTTLSVWETRVTDRGLGYFKDCRNLTTIDLRKTQVSDTGLEHLKELKALELLYLHQAKVSGEGVKKLAATLPGCKIEWDGGVIEPSQRKASLPAAP